jgi:hypothetical protein
LGTQQHLELNPGFLSHLCGQTGAQHPLLLLDESDLLVKANRRELTPIVLERFIAAQVAVLAAADKPPPRLLKLLELTRLLAEATTADFQRGRWIVPRINGGTALAIQRAGRNLYGAAFHDPTFELAHFARSDRASRERTAEGAIAFTRPPELGDNFIIFSGSIAKELARYRLDPDHRRPGLLSPLENHRFESPRTRWYNIASVEGAEKYFPRNARTLLNFFAEKIARNILAGRRTLLVARKKFRELCASYLTRRLSELEVGPVHIITGDWDRADLGDPRTLPLISYGITGVNLFEGFDCAYCLTSYYANVAAVAETVQDFDASSERFPLRIEIEGDPRRRRARLELPDDRATVLPRVAQWVLEQKEANVVVQAVGRVRPFTRPREVITFQCDQLPGVQYTWQCRGVSEARRFFRIETRRRSLADVRSVKARRLKALRLTNTRIAEEIGVSLSTVRRYLRDQGESRNLLMNREEDS